MSGGSMAASLRRPRRPLDGAGDFFRRAHQRKTHAGDGVRFMSVNECRSLRNERRRSSISLRRRV